MKIGFTGSREGMSQSQKENLVLILKNFIPTEFHHGDCEGADSEAHDIVREFFPDCKIVVHPPSSDYLRAFKKGDVILQPLPYLQRDRSIVDSSEFVIGAPKQNEFTKGSGSWFTINYAKIKEVKFTVLKR